jgi:hypothetical protein
VATIIERKFRRDAEGELGCEWRKAELVAQQADKAAVFANLDGWEKLETPRRIWSELFFECITLLRL